MESGTTSRRRSMRDILGFALGLAAFLGLGRIFRRRPGRAKVYETHGSVPPPPDPGPGHETSDVRLGPILMLGVGLVVAGIVGHLLLWGMFNWFTDRQARADAPLPPLAQPEQIPPEPRLQVSPPQDWQEMLVSQQQLLSSYGQDQNGAIRIPIERAMDLLAERGLPARSEGELQEWPGLEEGHELESEGGQE